MQIGFLFKGKMIDKMEEAQLKHKTKNIKTNKRRIKDNKRLLSSGISTGSE